MECNFKLDGFCLLISQSVWARNFCDGDDCIFMRKKQEQGEHRCICPSCGHPYPYKLGKSGIGKLR